MTAPAIELTGVAKAYGDSVALRDVSLHVERGEIVGFVGPNGSGKSTCLRLLTGLTFRSGGKIEVLGLDPDRSSVAIRRRCCYLAGETSLYLNLTGAELLRFTHSGYRLDAELEREMLAIFDLPLRRKVRTYSSGMKQRLALLATLVPDVDLYLLDEPDRNLDPSTQEYLRGIVRRLGERGKSIVFCSHHLGDVEVLAKRQIFLLNGKVIADEHVREVRDALRKEVRVRLVEGTPLPEGAREVVPEPDGSLRVQTAGEPLAWISQIEPKRVLSVEYGATHLDLLYRRLTKRAEQS